MLHSKHLRNQLFAENMDKSVEVDFDWVRNVVAEGKTREHGVSTEREDTFLLLDVRRSTDSVIATS